MSRGGHFIWHKPDQIKPKWPSCDAVIQERVAVVAKMITKQYRRWDIIAFGINKRWVSPSAIDAYISKAKHWRRELLWSQIYNEINTILAQNEIIKEQASSECNRKVVLACLIFKAEMLWFDPSKTNRPWKKDIAKFLKEWDRDLLEWLLKRKPEDVYGIWKPTRIWRFIQL